MEWKVLGGWRTIAWTVLVAALGACGGDGGSGEGRAAVPSFVLEGPDVRIGSVDDSAYAFSPVVAMAEGPRGRLFSVHRSEPFVRRWTPEGEADGRIGREGEGPGEFRFPVELGFFGDTLWVLDMRTYGTSFFRPDGTYLGASRPQVRFATPEGGPLSSPPRPERPLRDGTWHGAKPAWSREVALGELRNLPHVRMTSAGELLDTVWVDEARPTDILAFLRDQGGTFTSQPFGDDALWAVTPEGTLVVADRRAWSGQGEAVARVTWIGSTGDTLDRVSVPYAPEELPRARVDSVVLDQAARLHEGMSRFQPGLALGEVERAFLEGVYRPGWLPPVRELVVAPDGTAWLQRPESGEGGHPWWMVRPGEGLVGEVAVPEGLRVLGVDGDRVLGVEQDAYEVDYLVRYRVVPAG